MAVSQRLSTLGRANRVATLASQTRIRSTLSSTSQSRTFADDVAASEGGLAHRMRITAEVTVSKLFPAGFMWQFGSVVAEGAGMTATDAGFFLTTGVFDGIGVAVGHTVFYTLAKGIYLPNIDLREVRHTGILLGAAAFCSGTAWQPLVNFAADWSFNSALAFTGAGCTLAFLGGLRIGRRIWPSLGLDQVAGPEGNFSKDTQLSVAIGGAGACFVGTDISFADNWLRPIVGVEEHMSNVTGMITAGSSTALGFLAVQMSQNIVVPKGVNWTD